MKKVPDIEMKLLRQKAEESLKKRPSGHSALFTEADMLGLIHELEVHQVELEMQNDELTQANTAAKEAIGLYDFAPTGYFTILSNSEILRCNLSGAALLGRVCSQLTNYRFESFISRDTKPVFTLFLEKVFRSHIKESCEIIIELADKPPKYIHLTGIVTENASFCLLVATDISEHKSLEALNEILLSSLPYPAMYIRKKDMVVLKANKYAMEMGAKPGGQCWRGVMKSEYISDRDKLIAAQYPDMVPAEFHVRCTFCQADKCFTSAMEQNNSELTVFDEVWDTHWNRVNNEVFLHYAVNISKSKKAEELVRQAHDRLRRFVDSDIVGIIIADPKGEIIECNNYYLDTIGYSRADFEAGKINWREITPPEWLFTDEIAINELREKGKCTPYEKEYIRKDGNRVFVQIMDALFPGPDEQIAWFILDITVRKQAEIALQQSELKYRELIENSPDAIFIYSEGTIEYVNKESLSLMAVNSAEELIGKPVLQFVHPDYTEAVSGRMKNMADDGAVLPVNEEKFIRPDGSEVYVEVKAMPIRYENKKAVQLIIRDISERKKAEKALKESEDRNKALLEANPDLMFLMDKNGRFIDFHNSSPLPFYKPADFFIGKNISDVLPPDVAGLTKTKLNELLQTGQIQVFNYQLLVNNKLTDFESRLVSYGESKALAIVRDITEARHAIEELKNSELNFKELFESNSDGIIIFNISPEGSPSTILDMNENAAKMVGFTKEEMILLTPNNFEKNVTQEKMEKRMQDLLSKGFSDFETIIFHKDGHAIDVEIKVIIINYNKQPALMNIVRDITDRKNNEKQLREYAIELSKQIAEKDKFFSIIAHDLRGPFNGFLSLSEIMAEGSENLSRDDMQKMAGVMKKSATNLFRLLGNLLEWSRMQRGITAFNPVRIALHSKIREITGLALEAADKKGIAVEYDIPEKLIVTADENMFDVILRNLTANAVKYTSEGGIITISATPIHGNAVEFAVKDTGIGMSRNILDNLFNLDVNTSRKGTAGELSTGLGLIICKDFIEKHNGTLHIESEPGKGTTFSFTLAGQVEGENIIPLTSLNPTDKLSDQSRKLNILIAEDEETSDLLLSIALNKISLEIYHAKTGFEVIDMCRSYPGIDLILMDIQMPDMDGLDATRKIRQFNKDVIIIAQTAYAFSNDREKAIEAGCNDYIPKPISQAELLEVIGKYVR